jgi:type II secretory pathway pseudopilin PulG
MAVMGVLLGTIATVFGNTTRAQSDQTERIIAENGAQTSLIRMRRDIRCASGTPTIATNAYGGNTLTLAVPSTACPAVTTATAGVMWCTIPVSGSTSRYRLYRETSGNCDGVSTTYMADYLTSAVLWTVPSCTSGRLPTVSASLPVNTEPTRRAGRTFTLQDSIALRNASLC